MAEIFHGIVTANINTGNWLPLPALPAGANPRRRIIFRGTGIVEFGYCTPNQNVQDSGVMCAAGASTQNQFARDSGVVSYDRITVRGISASATTDVYVYSISSTDSGPRGM
jgi:hypothetical protein